MLHPMVDSCFPAEFLKDWNRSIFSTGSKAKQRLNSLMQFLKNEVEEDERISLAIAGLTLQRMMMTEIIYKEKLH